VILLEALRRLVTREAYDWSVARICSSPPAVYCLASDGHPHKDLLENPMSVLQRSVLKKHLSTRTGDLPHHMESQSTLGARVIPRDGNLITLPASILNEEAVKAPDIDQK
jgi:hypothetical protein